MKNVEIVKAEIFGAKNAEDAVIVLPCVPTVALSVSTVQKTGVKIVILVTTVTIYPVKIAESVRIVQTACVKTAENATTV